MIKDYSSPSSIVVVNASCLIELRNLRGFTVYATSIVHTETVVTKLSWMDL